MNAYPLSRPVLASAVLLAAWVGACSPSSGDPNPGSSGASSGDGDGDGDGGGGGQGDGGGGGFDIGGGGTTGSGGSTPVDPCVAAACGPGQRCEVTEGTAACVDKSCEELMCKATEECRPHERGGHTCVTAVCEEDVDCQPSDYCSEEGTCVPDVCAAGSTSCSESGVTICASNGSEQETPYSCGSESSYESVCEEGTGEAGCTCEDDWDCPAYTVCQVGHCVGTGFEPTCTLPPTNFEDTDPQVELHWGTDEPGGDAHDGTGELPPWPMSTEVQATPLVANLDDDNGDGLINELDYPEVIFVTYQSGQNDNSGILRAVHGGGPKKGKDFFAVCANSTHDENVWKEGDALPATACTGDGRSRSPAAIGDLTMDGVPEIVQVTANHGFRVLSNTGDILLSMPNDASMVDGGISLSPTIANLDNKDLPELILGGTIYVFDFDAEGALMISHEFAIGAGPVGTNDIGGPMTCVADLTATPGQEVVAGPAVYSLPAVTACAAPPCQGAMVVEWVGSTVNGNTLLANADGLCAVADLWGASADRPGPENPPDGTPEVILIGDGNLMILEGATGTLIHQESLDPDSNQLDRGGAPNVDDFDGDGYLEVATALSDFYKVVDLQEPEMTNCPAWSETLPLDAQEANPNPVRTPGDASCTDDTGCNEGAVCNEQLGQCVCLHNGWQRGSDDSSSRLTSSSIFDFNGDGAAEVLYNDECEFRIFDGASGHVHFATVSRGRTWTENPVVADVDNDGNAEVVTFANTETTGDIKCDDDGQTPIGPNGIRVWGDPADTWVPARRIWNQQSYHVTNVTESGRIPLNAPNSWETFNARTYNTYRSQPRAFGVAPDLTVTGVGVFSPDAACGELSATINITYEITNAGDLRVGPGVELEFYGIWAGAEVPLLGNDGMPLTALLADGVDAGRSIIETVTFDLANQTGHSTPPEAVRVQVDTAGEEGFGSERECDETNNALTRTIEQEQLADLTVLAGAADVDCGGLVATVNVTVTNAGTLGVSDVAVQLFAGNPAQGGMRLTEHVLPGTIAPGASVTVELTAPDFPEGREVTLWAFVDPSGAVEECNEADNTDPAENPVYCPVDIIR